MAHSSQVPSSPPPNSPSSPSAFSFNNSDPAALGYHQINQASSKQLNEELIETCTDLISRYTHGQCSDIQHKNPCADYLIDRSNSQTWLHGNSLITISTSRCNAPSSHGGLCDNPCNCWCQGWAEILIRRPTGNTCWLTRLQNTLGHMPPLSSPEMILLPKDSKTDVALKVFDRIQPYETHKIGVVYVGSGQVKNRTEILANKHGSRRYVEFLRNLGTLINLSDIDTQTHFIGGLDVNGSDGQFTYFWQDSITQVVFHVATLMPIRANDLQCNEKIRHIGNDHVCIVYNDSGTPFELITIKVGVVFNRMLTSYCITVQRDKLLMFIVINFSRAKVSVS